ncbi:hypothetical protein D3C81_2155730 [compost metagenome]
MYCLGAIGQHQFFIFKHAGIGGDGFRRGINAADVGVGVDGRIQLFRHLRDTVRDHLLGLLAMCKGVRQHRLGIKAAAICGDHD